MVEGFVSLTAYTYNKNGIELHTYWAPMSVPDVHVGLALCNIRPLGNLGDGYPRTLRIPFAMLAAFVKCVITEN